MSVTTPSNKVRVLVADDSPVVRRLVERVLGRDPGIEVIGTVANGAQVLQGAIAREYDVLVLDLEMPEFDGLATLRALHELRLDLAVLVFTGADTEGIRRGLAAFQRGAVDVLSKPGNGNLGGSIDELQAKMPELVKALAERRRRREGAGASVLADAHQKPTAPPASLGSTAIRPAALLANATPPALPSSGGPSAGAAGSAVAALRCAELLVVGCSTGGPNALAKLLAALPRDLRVPVLIVQHMPEGFTTQLAARLDRESPLRVSEAKGGEAVTAGGVWLAPGGKHLEVVAKGSGLVTRLTDGPLENSCRPAVDPLFRSAARAVGANALAVVLTGMGQDGLEGARAIRAAGGRVLVQDQATSVVWGMPGAIAKANLADEVLPLEAVAPAILTDLDRGRRRRSVTDKDAA